MDVLNSIGSGGNGENSEDVIGIQMAGITSKADMTNLTYVSNTVTYRFPVVSGGAYKATTSGSGPNFVRITYSANEVTDTGTVTPGTANYTHLSDTAILIPDGMNWLYISMGVGDCVATLKTA